jgi:hypothetical protein
MLFCWNGGNNNIRLTKYKCPRNIGIYLSESSIKKIEEVGKKIVG